MEKFDLKNFKAAVLFTTLLFLMCLENFTNIAILQTLFRHIDELLILVCVVYLLLHIHFILKKKTVLVYLWIGMLSIGAVSSILFRYQGFLPSAVDALLICSKFIIGYLTAYVYASLHPGSLCQRMSGAARIITLLLFVIAVHDLLMTPFFPRGEYRYFTKSLVLMFPHSTFLAAAMATLLILLGYTDKHHQNKPYMFMATFIGMMTLRGKAIAFFAVYWALYICIKIFKKRNYTGLMVFGGIGSIIIGFERIFAYFFNNSQFSPRRIMMVDSISLALKHFPFGTGFGSFGSAIAAQNYSPLYTQLGYPNLDGMSPEDSSYLYDCFWPVIFAQFGLIGTILFLCVLIQFFTYCIRSIKKDRIGGFSMLMILINMLISSIAEASFFNPVSMLLFALFGLMEVETQRAHTILNGGNHG